LAVKSGEFDAIMIVDIENHSTEKITLGLDGIYSVDWSADGTQLAFVGVHAPQSDIFTYTFATKALKNLTNDLFSDFDPVFSRDGSTVFFVSDRDSCTSPEQVPAGFRMNHLTHRHVDIYSISLKTGLMKRITNLPASDQTSPVVAPDGKKLLFISDKCGINNIYSLDLSTGTMLPITNSISGLYQLSINRDGSKLVFSSLNEAGFDIYLLLRPFDRRLTVTELESTEYVKQMLSLPRAEKPRELFAEGLSDSSRIRRSVVIASDTAVGEVHERANTRGDYSSYVFTAEAIRDTNNAVAPIKQTEVVDNRDAEGNFVPRRYKLNFSPDLVYGAANYSTFYGLEGSTLMAFSDMLGDHQIIFQTNLLLDLKNSDYALSYFYLPGRIDYGLNGFHSARFIYVGDTLYRFRTWGVGGVASFPIDRFNRFDLSMTWLNLSKDDLDDPANNSKTRSFVLPTLTYVRDNSIWQGGWFAPNNGSRFFGTVYGTPKIGSSGLEMLSAIGDYRTYMKIARDFLFAFRLSGGASIGKNAQQFFIGGTEGWINRSFERGDIPIENAEDFIFLTPILPLRGYNYNSMRGTHFSAVNMELRFPLVRYLILGIPIGFQNILGTAFFDMGTAWSDSRTWKGLGTNSKGETVTQDLLMSTGLGTRLVFFGFPLRVDVAWKFRWGGGFSPPIYLVSLGADF
jgi:hypothetical protein